MFPPSFAVRKRNRRLPSVRLTQPIGVGQRRPTYLKHTFIATILTFGLLLTCVGLKVAYIVVGTNFHTVIDGKVYRSAQPSSANLRDAVAEHGIRTVINLRGPWAGTEWYKEEVQTARALNVAHHDVGFSSTWRPSTNEMKKLLDILDQCEYPVLFHCRRGADRTGLVAELVLLMQSDADLEEAKQQLSLRYGHVPIGRWCELDQVLKRYEKWLKKKDLSHQPETLRNWLRNEYSPGPCRAEIEPIGLPDQLPSGKSTAVRFRVHNRSDEIWRLKQSANCGVHLKIEVRDMKNEPVVECGAGYFDANVLVGQSVELVAAIPPIRQSGRYYLFVDMVDEQRAAVFSRYGSTPFVKEINVIP